MPAENRVPHFYLSTAREHSLSLSLSLSLCYVKKKKIAKLNAFPKADENRARRSNPISANLSRGGARINGVLLYGAARSRADLFSGKYSLYIPVARL